MADGVSTCAGAAVPSNMGPMVTPLPTVIFSTLNRMLAESRLGQTSRLASPVSVLSDTAWLRSATDSALSACISPSDSMSGAISRNSSRARRIFSAAGRLDDPKLECDTKATLGGMPKLRTSIAAIWAMAASNSASGSSLT